VIEGIDRLVIGVRDMDRALGFFREVLGVQFTELQGPASDLAGCRLAMSLDQHLELLSPVREPQQVTNPPDPLELRRRLQQSEAVLYAIVFKVANLDAAIAHAASHGVRVVGERFAVAREAQLGLNDFAEIALDESATFGVKMALSEFRRDAV